MKTKIGLSITLAVLLLLVGRSTEAAKIETTSVNISKFEQRLQKIEQRLEQVDSPIQQMGPESADIYKSGVNDIQISLDEVNERLAMVRFVTDRDGSAPQDKRDLAQAELDFIETDIVELEQLSSSMANEIDDVVWY